MTNWPTPLPGPDLTEPVLVLRLRPWNASDEDAVLAACKDPAIPRWITAIPIP